MAESGDQNQDVFQEERLLLKLETCMQIYSWDCGLACCCMVLRYLGKDDSCVYTSDLDELQCGQSIWTIDLGYLLLKYKVRVEFSTVTLGVDDQYARKPFYMRNFDKDAERVSKKFAEASQSGLDVSKRSLSIKDIVNHLSGGNLLICLVDWSSLECIWCDRVKQHCLNWCGHCCRTYQGHYVVVCGFDLKKKYIFYKNPSYDEDVCCSRMDKFDKARKSHGTDEDILLIYKQQSKGDHTFRS
ncbi:protein GUCD1-like [Saccostrea echinata]|uniref:protein GUCD1-like n=1 Tax=Saccostrea echinata TaxID=191078 RepID=UPI002A83219D|nr:protein GUCD1-like [Saccostrea echinata]XP_061166635.1 protein GUCD1-like [Saccostrea echinata]